jgi:hypothetical protein
MTVRLGSNWLSRIFKPRSLVLLLGSTTFVLVITRRSKSEASAFLIVENVPKYEYMKIFGLPLGDNEMRDHSQHLCIWNCDIVGLIPEIQHPLNTLD